MRRAATERVTMPGVDVIGLVDGVPVLESQDGSTLPATSAPRPFLHPVRTLGQTVLTALAPEDHPWHAGVGIAVPDVDGVNTWGGGTYVDGLGYVDRHDHGVMRLDGTEHLDGTARPELGGGSAVEQSISWRDRTGRLLLRERREVRWARFGVGVDAGAGWGLAIRTTLTAPDRAVSLGSPATNGRSGATYGGFFWRLAACTDVEVHTPSASGEAAVHGRVAPWLLWSARFGERLASVVAVPADAETAHDAWFVRVAEYAGFGSAIAGEARLRIPAHASVRRGFRIAVLDGRLDVGEVDRVVAEMLGG